MPSPEKQSSPSPQGKVELPSDEMIKGCLYRQLKFVGLLLAFLLLIFFLVNNYKVGSMAFKKDLWESAIFFLEKVETGDEHYKDAREKLRLAREKLRAP